MIRPGRRDCLLPGQSRAGSLTGIGRHGSWHLRDGERHCEQRRSDNMFGLPAGILACLFDMDGVVTQTALVHAAAWKQMFDDFLRQRAEQTGEKFVPFDSSHDYDQYVDGKPRLDGTRSFLQSRGISLPEGSPGDKPGSPTIEGLSNKKNNLVVEKIRTDGVTVYEGSIRYIKAGRAGLRSAIVSSSANTVDVLNAAGIADLFDVRIDGAVAEERHLAGKPAPDTFLAAAHDLGVTPAQAAVFEDAQSGVAAGRAGHFAFVVGVDRVGQAEELLKHGADIVVRDLAELLD
jgi:beta-phosphoglucomutase family hydrolase